MPRARNIKPSFFSNDELAEIPPVGRLLFIGMWTLADYKGDFIWREKRVKAELLPYDNCDIKEIAINLDKSGFIRYYSDGEKLYLNIVNFLKHQNPHKNERDKGSLIPAYSEEMRQAVDLERLAINLDKSGLKRNDSTSDPADSCFLIPDSLILNPDPLILNPETLILNPETLILNPENKELCESEKTLSHDLVVNDFVEGELLEKNCFDDFYSKYPVKKNKINAKKTWDKLSDSKKEEAISGLSNYIASVESGISYCNPQAYLNNERWNDEPSKNRGNNGNESIPECHTAAYWDAVDRA